MGGISLFQAVGYLTGEMKEYRCWLKGKQMPREEAAPTLAWVEEAAPSLTH